MRERRSQRRGRWAAWPGLRGLVTEAKAASRTQILVRGQGPPRDANTNHVGTETMWKRSKCGNASCVLASGTWGVEARARGGRPGSVRCRVRAKPPSSRVLYECQKKRFNFYHLRSLQLRSPHKGHGRSPMTLGPQEPSPCKDS